MSIWWQRLTAFIIAMLVTIALASLVHTLMVQQALIAVGAEIPFSARIMQILRDFAGLVPTLGTVLAISLAIAFLIAGFLKKRARRLSAFAYPLAGWAAVLLALLGMKLVFGFSAIAGARTGLGLLLMSLSGLVGGIVYAIIASRRKN